MSATTQGNSSLAERYSQLARETPGRRLVDFEPRALEIVFSMLLPSA